MDPNKMPRKLWEHSDPKSTAMWKFMQDANQRYGLNLKTFQELYSWSCENRVDFWSQLWEMQNWIHEGTVTKVVEEHKAISELPRWFEGVRLNWAENFLWSTGPNGERSTHNKRDDVIAATEVREGNSTVTNITWGELRGRVEELAQALKARGVGVGDRVVVVGAHSIQTLIVFLATTWLGGVFSSSSTDMGVAGLLQRTVQIDPKFVFFDDGALYNGKVLDLREKIAGMSKGMKECRLFEKIVVIQRFDKPYDTKQIPKTERLENFLNTTSSQGSPPIARVGFQDPMMIYYSSGTTGTPKAIVHGVGPLLMNSHKDGVIHRDITPSDVGLQYTTTGWIMYLASVAVMMFGARAVLYDGSPFVPDLKVLLRVAEEQGVTSMGISPRWMGELMKNGVAPREVADLRKLRLVTSTGMVLPDQLFEWFYDVAFPKDVHLANISGGTDIAGCFAMDNPLEPVYVGGCQGGCLGVPVEVFDHDLPEGSEGKPLPHGTPGDLVSTGPFPNIPLYLWNDPPTTTSSSGPGPKYFNAYFSRFRSVWAQGDFCAIHPLTGNIHLLGRSDGVLNPSGIRFGSADIYAVLERRMPKEVREALCVGQRRPQDLDERVVLFLLMRDGVKLDKEMVRRVKAVIGEELTKRHVPKYVFEVKDIPVTVNGKKVELPVKHIISGRTVKPSGTLLNPGSLDFFYQFQEIEKLEEPRAKL